MGAELDLIGKNQIAAPAKNKSAGSHIIPLWDIIPLGNDSPLIPLGIVLQLIFS